MTGFASSFLHISPACSSASSAGRSISTSYSFTVRTAATPSNPRDSRVFLVFFPSGSATPFLSSILISTTVIAESYGPRGNNVAPARATVKRDARVPLAV